MNMIIQRLEEQREVLVHQIKNADHPRNKFRMEFYLKMMRSLMCKGIFFSNVLCMMHWQVFSSIIPNCYNLFCFDLMLAWSFGQPTKTISWMFQSIDHIELLFAATILDMYFCKAHKLVKENRHLELAPKMLPRGDSGKKQYSFVSNEAQFSDGRCPRPWSSCHRAYKR